jgi:hypothetical protein
VSDGVHQLRAADRYIADSEASLQNAEAILRNLLSQGEPSDAAFTLLRELRTTLAHLRIHRHVLTSTHELLTLSDASAPGAIAQIAQAAGRPAAQRDTA